MTAKKRFPLSNYWNTSSETFFIATAFLVGIGAGLGAIIFRYLIRSIEWIGYDWFPELTQNWGNAYIVIIPAVGGLIVGPLIYFFAREAKGHGVPEVMEAVALRGGRIRPIVAVIKSLASSITIGSGGSVGREGPIVQIGAALGSTVGQKLGLSDDRIRNLVACGAAGGIAATFNAPIAGVVFALEIILGDFSVRYFSSVVVSAVTASVIGRAVLGNEPAFHIPLEYGVKSLWEFAVYPVLGILAAFVGVLFVRMLYWSEDLFAKWKSVPEWLQPMFGGILLGVIGLLYPRLTGVSWEHMPQIFNVGYNTIESALANDLALKTVLILLALKMLATSITLGTGGSGGVFAPGLFMGAMFGAAFELSVNKLLPGILAPAGAYALVGMAALFASTAHAPLTAILILFELTGDYQIMLPLMFTVVITTIVSQRLLKGENIYSLKLTRRGVHLQRGRDIDILHGVLVSEVLTTNPSTISPDLSLKELSEVFARSRRRGLVILDNNEKLWGLVTISDLEQAIERGVGLSNTRVKEIATKHRRLLVTYPDESIGDALNKMSRKGFGRLPVVTREDPEKLVGLVQQQDIVKAYNLALTKRAEIQHRTKRMQMRNIDGTEFIDLTLEDSSTAVGRSVEEIARKLPHECILISIRREGSVLIPHGETRLQSGDKLTAFIQSQDIDALRHCLNEAEYDQKNAEDSSPLAG
ncbi:MAG: chloride channel protein [Anaerolineales bacterium]|nr:chloride channel protein [Anaerolineales bacterium]